MIDNPKELLELIDSCLKPKQKEKQENGEVFTPIGLINEMLDNLDKHYSKEKGRSIFTESTFKWFDPASGMGNFPVALYFKLMEGLKPQIPNDEDRKKHIIENMLYMSELNNKNVCMSHKIFNEYKLNLYEGDTLELDTTQEWGIDTFDVIIGNPPFQKKVGDRKTQPIWHLFVNYSLKHCRYLLLVHPSGWRSPEGVFKNVKDLIMSKNLKYLSMNDFKKGKKIFEVDTNFDYYVLQNTIVSNNITTITDIDDKTYEKNINTWTFIPSGGFDLYEKILANKNDKKVNVLYDSSLYETRQDYMSNKNDKVNVLYDRTLYGTDKQNMSNKKNEKFIYPCVYTITIRDGIKFFYSSVKHPKTEKDMFVPKVIWSNGLGTYPIIDLKGEYGLTQFSYAIIDEVHNLKHIENALNNPKFIELMKYVKFQNNKYNYKVISLFKKDFWKYFV